MEKWDSYTGFFLILIFFYSSLTSSAGSVPGPPDAYLIEGVTQHKQINALMCGEGALEILFDFWGEDINQENIANVARSSSKGTYAWDMVRTGHFSYLSASNGSYFPHQVLTAGFPQRQIGYASFNYSNNSIWWNELKALIASNIPVILLMKYAPNDDTGHYRVLVGYNETEEVVYFVDPWDRDLKRVTNPDGTVTWTKSDFENAWNYSKYGAPNPYWGTIMMPWSINLTMKGNTSAGSVINITATITYPCPEPFDCTAYPASDTVAEIILPSGMYPENASPGIKDIGNLHAGETTIVSWNVLLDTDKVDSNITVKAEGLISGEVPDVRWPGVFYPAYSYEDKIGGEAKLQISKSH